MSDSTNRPIHNTARKNQSRFPSSEFFWNSLFQRNMKFMSLVGCGEDNKRTIARSLFFAFLPPKLTDAYNVCINRVYVGTIEDVLMGSCIECGFFSDVLYTNFEFYRLIYDKIFKLDISRHEPCTAAGDEGFFSRSGGILGSIGGVFDWSVDLLHFPQLFTENQPKPVKTAVPNKRTTVAISRKRFILSFRSGLFD